MEAKKDWTVMIYMVGDNNLSVDMSYALEDLRRNVARDCTDRINLFVYYTNNSPELPAIYCDFSDADDPVYQYATEVPDKFTDQPDAGFGSDPAVASVVDFCNWCVRQVAHGSPQTPARGRPAEHYSLIMAGHTMGFLSNGLLKEESTNRAMTLPGLQRGLRTVCRDILGQKLAFLGFDSCVMSMFEVGYQFKDVADTMVASAGSIPNSGWSYAEILGSLLNDRTEIRQLAADFVQEYIIKQTGYSIGGVSVDMAAWDLAEVQQLDQRIGEFSDCLLKCFAQTDSDVYCALRRIFLQVHFDCQTYMCDQNIDLGDFCSLLCKELDRPETVGSVADKVLLTRLRQAAGAVLEGINKCVILSGFSGGEYQFTTGIAMFLPWSLSAYQVSSEDYQNLSFVKHAGGGGGRWNKFLQRYLSEVSRRPARVLPDTYFANTSELPTFGPELGSV